MKPSKTFVAKVETTGAEVVIGIYPWAIDASKRQEMDDSGVGGRDLRTSDGRAVYKIGKGRYRILEMTGPVILVSDDPKAP